jgi:peptidoglycan/LPS O-acetylase OafA/YrhL
VAFHTLVALILVIVGKAFYASFILGSIISLLYVKGFSLPANSRGSISKAMLFIFGIYFSSYPQGNYTFSTIWNPLEWSFTNTYELFHVLGAFCLMLVVCFDRRLISFFSLKPLLYLGKISFSFYLLHFPIMCSIGSYVFSIFESSRYAIAFVNAFTISMLVSIALSHLYHKWVDSAGIDLSNKVGKLVLKD